MISAELPALTAQMACPELMVLPVPMVRMAMDLQADPMPKVRVK